MLINVFIFNHKRIDPVFHFLFHFCFLVNIYFAICDVHYNCSATTMVDEEDEEEIGEDYLERDMFETTDVADTPPPLWDMYVEDDFECDDDIDYQENTALLSSSIAKTEIVITPMSPVNMILLLYRFYISYRIIYVVCLVLLGKLKFRFSSS